MKPLLVLIILFISFLKAQAQGEKSVEFSPEIHFRTFWMNTSYPSDFKNDYALGSSLRLGGKVTLNDRWKLQAGYRIFANVWSSNIWESDALSGQTNRYETGLFDLLNPGTNFFGKLELLNISYESEKWGARLGRFGINTPWINPQDGRLSPTGMEGLEAWFAPSSRWKIQAWWIHQMSVRGTSKWLGIGESMGVFPVGRDIFGQRSQYADNTSSDFIGIYRVEYEAESSGKLEFAQTFVENISNTFTLTWTKSWAVGETQGKWIGGLQTGFQHGVGQGGNRIDSLSYKNPEDINWYVSGRFGFRNSRWLTHINVTGIQGNGRWLSPREWGKDPFFTFIPRERNEGFESVTALTWFGSHTFEKVPLEVYTHIGIHQLPDAANAAANKYNFVSYRQLNFGLKYRPKSLGKSSFHLLVMNKEGLDNQELSPNQRYNKLEMWHVNLIFDFYLN